MPSRVGVLRNGAISGEEPLPVPWRLEPLHAPLALARRPMRLLTSIISVSVYLSMSLSIPNVEIRRA